MRCPNRVKRSSVSGSQTPDKDDEVYSNEGIPVFEKNIGLDIDYYWEVQVTRPGPTQEWVGARDSVHQSHFIRSDPNILRYCEYPKT